ncbi:helix-turn-helix domain-containing protein [Priestia megaterium]|uniref:helix-turn-helix domain-containing protein n=1 Tax=Priestia TaxID=2800373 RepID=UPI000BFB7903|nr:XRE family transcriptional regulator [Priestia megaterium]MBD8845725.1 helix-turn-helix domain-containing protein [Priestia megaterium]MDD9795181.1 helix-turn-helix domain-containing protein [Priestia megaterium]MDN4861126.1 helix-turn-helix domain-containing protein [Priestia megaterium]PGO62613.1 transcriptional regulator [Priestia megaterium]USL37365.1 helix-turn-helix domain-containing protein [Priestia megaterium]
MVGAKIKSLRLKKGYSITRLAENAKISKSYLSHLEKGLNNNPSLHMLNKIASSLNTTIDELIEAEISHPVSSSKPLINKDWLYLIEQAIKDGMTKEEFVEFQCYLKFRKMNDHTN